MKKKILIIGNGFDLYHKLPTRYTDFLFLAKKWDTIRDKFIYNEGVNSNGLELYDVQRGEDGTLNENSLDDLIKMTHVSSVDINFLTTQFSENKWIQYFMSQDHKPDKWIDFENEIETVLQRIEDYFTELPNSLDKTSSQYFNDLMLETLRLFDIKFDVLK